MRPRSRTRWPSVACPFSGFSALHFLEKFVPPPFHLLRRNVLPARSQVPLVPIRVLQASGPVAPEHVLQWVFYGSARGHRLAERLVHVPDVEVDPDWRSTERLRRAAIHPGDLVAKEKSGVADLELRVNDGLSIRAVHPGKLLRAESPAVEIDGAIGAPYRQIRGYRVIPLRNRLHGQGEFLRFLHHRISFLSRREYRRAGSR